MNEFYQKAKNIQIPLFREKKEIKVGKVLKQGEEVLLDFGNHLVGYLSLHLSTCGHHQDSPILLQICFYEHASEFGMDLDSYHGWISKAWIQEEKIHVEETPAILKLERRYAFRYVKIKVLAASDNYKVVVDRAEAEAVSSADRSAVKPAELSPEDATIDEAALRTLHECMQEIFEDGPKRDRRLWLGDLRLQAKTNYLTFRNNDMVKKCLYLFAGSVTESGLVASNVFLHPEIEGDFQCLTDYSMLFIPAVCEYYEATGEKDFLREMEPVCHLQFESMHKILESGSKTDSIFPFIDWSLTLKKDLSMIGVYLYCLRYLIQMEDVLGKDFSDVAREVETYTEKALRQYDDKEKLFVCEDQISYASQVWMILGDVVSREDGKKLLKRLKEKDAVGMVSPYMNHYYLEALVKLGLYEEAHRHIAYYWGGMIRDGADTFYEIFNPENPEESPYGGKIVHSFCHAWSCTPSYFLRKYSGNGTF